MCVLCVNRCEGITTIFTPKDNAESTVGKKEMFLKCSERNKDILNSLKIEGRHRLRVDAGCMNVQYFIAYSISENEKEDYFAEN